MIQFTPELLWGKSEKIGTSFSAHNKQRLRDTSKLSALAHYPPEGSLRGILWRMEGEVNDLSLVPIPFRGIAAHCKALCLWKGQFLSRPAEAGLLIYPAAAVFFVGVVWGAEVAVFVEVLFGVVLVLAHINLKFAAGATALPAMIRISDSVKAFRDPEKESATGQEFQVKIAEQSAAEVRNIVGPADIAHRAGQRDENQDGHHVFGLDGDGQREHVDFLFAKEECEGHEQAKNATGSTHSPNHGCEAQDAPEAISHGYGREGSADYAEEVKLQKLPPAPVAVQRGPEHPQGQHVEEDVEESCVQKSIRDDLPHGPVVDYLVRSQRESYIEGNDTLVLPGNIHQEREEVNRHIDPDQQLDGAGKGRKSK